MDKNNQAPTMVVVLVRRPDGTSQVVNFLRESALPEDFTLNGSKRLSSVGHEDVPARLKFFFDKIDGSADSDGSSGEPRKAKAIKGKSAMAERPTGEEAGEND